MALFKRGYRAKLKILEDQDFGIGLYNKGDINMSIKNYYGEVEYRMSAEMAQELLRSRKGEDSRLNPQEYLCKYVNENCGLKGYCTLVTTTL